MISKVVTNLKLMFFDPQMLIEIIQFFWGDF
jgi:hypothetical protein